MVALSLLAILCVGPSRAAEPATSPVLYLIVDETTVRAEPEANARSLTRLQRYDVVSGRERVPGWLQIEATTDPRGTAGGWVPLDSKNVIAGNLEALKLRSFHVRQSKWTDAVKLDILRGRVREGFTGTQVQLALGDPLKKELRHVAGDVAEEWVYPDRRVLFSHAGVRTVELIEDR
jgi:hypothetical protein